MSDDNSTQKLDTDQGTVRLDDSATQRMDANQGTVRLDDNSTQRMDANAPVQQIDINNNAAGNINLQANQFVQDTVSDGKRPGKIFTPGQVVQLEEGEEDYTIDSLISDNSGEAVIYKVISNNKPFVFKYYKPNCHLPKKVMTRIRNNPQDRIIRVYDFGSYEDQDFEIMEYAEGGTLDDYLKENGPIKDIAKLKNIVGQINEGLKQLHGGVKIIYQDLKPENIYFRDKERTSVILADFGISSVMPDGEEKVIVTANSTTIYAAPQLSIHAGESEAYVGISVDYFALGITMLQFWLGEPPFANIKGAIRRNMIEKRTVQFPSDMDSDFKTLIKGLIDPDDDKRWGNQDIERWLSGEPLHNINDQKITITYTPQMFKENVSYASPAELAELMDKDHARGISYLYNGTITSWIKKAGDEPLSEEIKNIVSAYADDQEAGLYRAIYTLDPDRPFITHGGRECFKNAEIANALMAESDYYMKELKNNKNALFYLNILVIEGYNGKNVVENFQKYFEEYSPKRALAHIYLILMDSEGITVGSKTYANIEEIAAETDKQQIDLIKQAVQEGDSLFLVWLCVHYNANFDSTEEFKNLPVWNRFFLLCQFPFLSYKELIKDWQKQALNDLCALIYFTPGRADLFEAYARQGLPFRGQAEGEGIEGGPTPMCFLAANFNNNNTDIGTGIELTRFLHENGADVNEYSGNGSLPLTNAITKRSLNLVNLLLELGADPNKTHVFAPLLWALFQSEDSEIEEVRIEIAKSLLEHKANANVVHNDVTPLMLALYFESPEKVELVSRLLAAGANVNKANSEGITPLMMAVVKYGNNNNNESKKNDLQVIELLLKNGAKTEVLTTNGYWSPLMRAADLDAYDAAELLIKYGAKKEFADKEAITAFGYASFKQHKKTAVLLDPGHSLVTKARLLSAGKVALSVLTIAWVFLTMDVLAKVILSFHFIYPVLLGASILISHLLAAYLLIIIHGLHVFLIKLRGTFSFISSGLFYIVSIPIAFPLLVALLQALTRLLPENVTAKLSIPEEILTRSSSFAMFSLYILFLALFMGAVLFFSKITGRFNKIMQIYRQFT